MNARTREEKRALLAKFKKPVDLELPSGLVAEVRRPPMAKWITSGEIPENLFTAATSAAQAGGKAGAGAIQNMPELFAFSIKIARAAIVWPRLTEEGQSAAEDEDLLDPYTLPLGDLSELLVWTMSGSPSVPVETASGEVGADALTNFRQDSEVLGDGRDGQDVREESGE